MRMVAIGAVLLGALSLGACNTTKDSAYEAPKPVDKMTNEEWCAFYSTYLAKSQVSPEVRKADLEEMRKRGCPGT